MNSKRFIHRLAGHFVLGILVAVAVLAIPSASHAGVGVAISVQIGPPALPVYAQPVCPGAGYIWTPGYWAWGPNGYYWVPGTWVIAPQPGLLWTPGYWGYAGGLYVWHVGYWGPHIGFYGGINYGFGYTGVGFSGGYWRGGVFLYNRAVTNVNVTVIHNTYVQNVHVTQVNRVSFNGPGGVMARPTPAEMTAERERRFGPTNLQAQHEHMAANNRAQWASENHGRPAFGATAHAASFNRADHPFNPPNHANGHPVNQPVRNNAGYHEQPHEQPHGQPHGNPHPNNNSGGHDEHRKD
jgi:WXXGXW repeat (2 copies)